MRHSTILAIKSYLVVYGASNVRYIYMSNIIIYYQNVQLSTLSYSIDVPLEVKPLHISLKNISLSLPLNIIAASSTPPPAPSVSPK